MNFGSVPPEALPYVAALAVAIAVLQAAVSLLRRWWRRRRMTVRMERAARGEERAVGLLEGEGFAVLGAQAVSEHEVKVDGRGVTVALRADYLAARGGLRYVVEVKTGALAPKIETSATRRQMLEYRIAFDVDGVLLVDAESGRVHEVTFPALDRVVLARQANDGFGVILVAAVAVALAVCVAVLVRPV